MPEYRHFTTAIMFIDMKGFTSRTSASSREELKKTLDEFENIVFPAVKKFQGKIIKGLGDAFLISFDSPTDSVLCGLEIQKTIKERNKGVLKKEKFEARVGISSGEVYERGGDIFGESVNLAARIQSIAKGGEVAFDESVYHAMNKNEISFTSLGKHKLKGIDRKIQVYQAHEKRKVPFFSRIRGFIRRNKIKFLIALIIFLFIIIISNQGVKELGEKWQQEAYSAIQKTKVNEMQKLLSIYEASPNTEKTITQMILAARMYEELGNRNKAIDELKTALENAEQDQLKEIYDIIQEREIELPKELTTRIETRLGIRSF